MHRLVICLFLLMFAQFSRAQTIVDFFENHGLLTAAKIAHFNTGFVEEKSSFQIYPQGIILDLHYDLGYNTILFIYTEDGFFTGMKLVHDTHWFPAFDMAATLVAMENTKTENVQDPVQKAVRQYYESQWNKPTNAFSNEELSTSLLFYAWINYIYRTRKGNSNSNIQMIEEIKSEDISKIDGIKIIGNKVFYKRVEEALSYLEKYVPEIYDKYFVNAPGHYGMVKEIRLNKEAKNTVEWDHTILMSSKYGNQYGDSNPVEFATILIHEMKHLDQYQSFAFENILKMDLDKYKTEHFGQTPGKLAKIEIEAYEYSLQFLNKVPISNLYRRTNIAHVETMVKKYKVLMESDELIADPDTRNSGCQKLDQFINIVDGTVREQGYQLKAIYCH